MSLINDMLRDLEVRKGSESVKRELPVLLGHADEIPPVGVHWVAYTATALILLGVFWAGWWVYREHSKTLAQLPQIIPIQEAPAANPMKPEPIRPASVEPERNNLEPSVPILQNTPPVVAAEPAPATAVENRVPTATPATVAITPIEPPKRRFEEIPSSAVKAVPNQVKPDVHRPSIGVRRRVGTQEDTAETLYTRALQYYESGQIEQAQETLERTLRLNPDNSSARLLLARTLASQGDTSAALATLAVQAGHGDSDEGAKLSAQLYLKEGNVGQAENVLAQMAVSGSTDPEVIGLRGVLRQRQGRHDEAVDYFRKAIAQQPAQVRWWVGLAISLEANERYEEALHAYESASELGGQSAELKTYMAGRMAALRASR